MNGDFVLDRPDYEDLVPPACAEGRTWLMRCFLFGVPFAGLAVPWIALRKTGSLKDEVYWDDYPEFHMFVRQARRAVWVWCVLSLLVAVYYFAAPFGFMTILVQPVITAAVAVMAMLMMSAWKLISWLQREDVLYDALSNSVLMSVTVLAGLFLFSFLNDGMTGWDVPLGRRENVLICVFVTTVVCSGLLSQWREYIFGTRVLVCAFLAYFALVLIWRAGLMIVPGLDAFPYSAVLADSPELCYNIIRDYIMRRRFMRQ